MARLSTKQSSLTLCRSHKSAQDKFNFALSHGIDPNSGYFAAGQFVGAAVGEAAIFVGTAGVGSAVSAGRAAVGGVRTALNGSRAVTDMLPALSRYGRLNGKIANAKRLDVVERYLGRHNIELVRNANDVLRDHGARAMFTARSQGISSLYLKTNATEYELLHELIHARQFASVGFSRYSALGQVAREGHVLNRILRSRRLNGPERVDAIATMGDYYRQNGIPLFQGFACQGP